MESHPHTGETLYESYSFKGFSPFSHRESCCSVLIGWCLPRVRKMAKSLPMKSADVPAYNSPSKSKSDEVS